MNPVGQEVPSALARRDPPGPGWWLALLSVCALLRLAWWTRDSMPMLFLGDSEAYLGTAIWSVVPQDRSFLYGYLVFLAGVLPGSLRALVAAQSACSVAAGVLLAAAVLQVSPGRRALAAVTALAWTGLEPLALLWERYVMAEAAALPAFAVFVLFGLRYLAAPRFGWLAGAHVAGTLVMALRLPFVGICWLGALVLPLLGALGRPRRNRSWIALRHGVGSLLLVAALQAGYRQAFATISGGGPGFQRADGLFLLSAWSPLLQVGDFDDPMLGETVLRPASRCMIADRRHRERQRWGEGCLVWELTKAAGNENAANGIAQAAARNILHRDPVGVGRLALQSWFDFFDMKQLRRVMRWDRSPWEYPERIRAMLAERFGLDGEAMPRMATATNRWFFGSTRWLLVLAASPALAWCAAAFRARRHHRAAQAAWVAIVATGLMAITVVAATSPIPRYLHALGWLAGLWVAELLDPGQDGGWRGDRDPA